MNQRGIDGLLGWMFLPALGAFIYSIAMAVVEDYPNVAVALGGIVVAVTTLVSSMRRVSSPRPRAAIALLLCALACLGIFYANMMGLPLMIIALALVVVEISFGVGVAVWLITGVIFLVVVGVLGTQNGDAWPNIVSSLLLTVFGVALGAVLRELDSSNAQLDRALVDLRSAAAVEKELVLAKERQRAAQELHDGLGYRLTLVGMSLDFADRMHERDSSSAVAEIRNARALTVEALDEMRLWVRALSPVSADETRGIGGFDAIAESFRGTGVEIEVNVEPGLPELTHEADLLACRFVQEGLTNALRHSQARRIEVDAQAVGDGGDGVRVTVRNPVAPRAHSLIDGPLKEGFGLRSVRERAELLGGSASARIDGGYACAVLELPAAERAA